MPNTLPPAPCMATYFPPSYNFPEYGLDRNTEEVVRKLQALKPHQRRVHLLRQTEVAVEIAEAKRNRRFLYKYLAVPSNSADPALERKKLHDLLVKGELYLSTVQQFNDPNEFRAKVELTSDIALRDRWIQGLAEESVHSSGLRGTKAAAAVQELVARMKINVGAMPRMMQNVWANQSADFGIFCFSQNPRSDLMWAHYARSHRGICVQLDYSLCPGVLALAHRVQYRPDLPELTWPEDRARAIEPIISKAEDWLYEAERRYVSRELKERGLRFDARAITGVILGQRFDEDPTTALLLKSVLDERTERGLPAPKVYSARRSDTSYSLAIGRAELV